MMTKLKLALWLGSLAMLVAWYAPAEAAAPRKSGPICRNIAGLTRCIYNATIPAVGEERTIKEFGSPDVGPYFRIYAQWFEDPPLDETVPPDPFVSTCALIAFFSGDPNAATGINWLASAQRSQLIGPANYSTMLTAGDTVLFIERAGVWFNLNDNSCCIGIVFSFAGPGRADRLFR